MKPPVTVGEPIHIKEKDYYDDVGALTLRITEIPAQLRDPEWTDLRGIEIAWNGDRRGERQMRVRASALRDCRSRETS
jgi:hypothetical protein